MIPPEHEHHLRPFNVRERPDGGRDIQSRCVCDLDTRTGEARTVLEQKLTVDAAGNATGLQYRFGGLWFSPLDLLRVGGGLNLEECPVCRGMPPEVTGIGPCGRCLGLGVLSAGAPLAPPTF